MAVRVIFTFTILVFSLIFAAGCLSTPVRLPQSASQVYKNNEVQQSLLLAAQNNILFYIPESTVREVEKSVVDQKCRKIEDPFWAESHPPAQFALPGGPDLARPGRRLLRADCLDLLADVNPSSVKGSLLSRAFW